MDTPSLTFLVIQASPQDYLSIPNTGVTFITFLTHEVFSISDIFLSFTLLCGHCLWNSCLSIYFSILGAWLITASCKHDLIDKWPSASWNYDPGEKRNPVDFLFYQNCLLLFSYLCPTINVMGHRKICILFLFVRNVLVSSQKHHHQDTSFCLMYLYIGYKPNQHGERNEGRFVLLG